MQTSLESEIIMLLAIIAHPFANDYGYAWTKKPFIYLHNLPGTGQH